MSCHVLYQMIGLPRMEFGSWFSLLLMDSTIAGVASQVGVGWIDSLEWGKSGAFQIHTIIIDYCKAWVCWYLSLTEVVAYLEWVKDRALRAINSTC